MTEAKLDLTIGGVSFHGEGEQLWLAEQMDKILQAAPQLGAVQPAPRRDSSRSGADIHDGGEFTATLAGYIREKAGETNQVQRFLATCDWLRRRGTKELTTSAVTKALSDNQQKRLSNPADCLNKNVAKGYCEKTGNAFFITPDGLKHLGYA